MKDLQSHKVTKSKPERPGIVAGAKPTNVRKEKTVVAAKYKGPNGETWSVRGLTPKWLATPIASGQPKESFLIAAAAKEYTVL